MYTLHENVFRSCICMKINCIHMQMLITERVCTMNEWNSNIFLAWTGLTTAFSSDPGWFGPPGPAAAQFLLGQLHSHHSVAGWCSGEPWAVTCFSKAVSALRNSMRLMLRGPFKFILVYWVKNSKSIPKSPAGLARNTLLTVRYNLFKHLKQKA